MKRSFIAFRRLHGEEGSALMAAFWMLVVLLLVGMPPIPQQPRSGFRETNAAKPSSSTWLKQGWHNASGIWTGSGSLWQEPVQPVPLPCRSFWMSR